MKIKPYLLLLYILGLSALTCCIEDLTDEDKPKTELEKLPPLTTTGENTFGCLVNGKALGAKHSLKAGAIYQQGVIQLGGGDENEDFDIGIKVKLNDPLEENTTYSLTDPPEQYAEYTAIYSNGLPSCDYGLADTFKGNLHFIKIDRSKFIVSGTFEFSSVNDECDTVHITDGRFDLKYIP